MTVAILIHIKYMRIDAIAFESCAIIVGLIGIFTCRIEDKPLLITVSWHFVEKPLQFLSFQFFSSLWFSGFWHFFTHSFIFTFW